MEKEKFDLYLEEADTALNSWAKKYPVPGCSIGRDKEGNIVRITFNRRTTQTGKVTGESKTITHEDPEENSKPKEEEKKKKCKTCGAKGLKRLIMGGAQLLKAELGVDAEEEHVIKKRKNTCLKCNKYDFGVCIECGCFCAAKVKLKSEQCPLEKW